MRPSVLIVEDDVATRTLLTVLMERSGFEVDAIGSGSDAITLLSSVKYSALLFDLLLPDTSGQEILAFLEVNDPDMIPHAVVLSSAPARELERVRQRYRDTPVMRKPFDLKDLTGTVLGVATNRGRAPHDMAAEFCRLSIVSGAKAGVILLADSDADRLNLAGSFGYSADVLGEFVHVDADAAYPACNAYRRGTPVWLNSPAVASDQYPEFETLFRTNRSYAIAALPLVRDGIVFGAAGWTFREPRSFTEQEQHRFEVIATILSSELGTRVPA